MLTPEDHLEIAFRKLNAALTEVRNIRQSANRKGIKDHYVNADLAEENLSDVINKHLPEALNRT